MERLTKLANKWGTDKGTEFEDSHGYTEFYQKFFEKYDNPKIIEIGTWQGASAKMLNDFFDGDCEIWTCDWNASYAENVAGMPNVHFVYLNADSKEEIEGFRKSVEDVGGFDIIIDDASHMWKTQMNLMYGLHSLLKEDGIYIIEDIHFSRLFDDPENSPLFFINFLTPNVMYTEEENNEMINKIKDVQIFSRKNHAFEMDSRWMGRSMTSVITFEK
jgi:predicted O-methyltransferase YrrM